jgi:hypothetical protein
MWFIISKERWGLAGEKEKKKKVTIQDDLKCLYLT